MLNLLGLKFTQNKKLTVFNKVQLIYNFFPSVLNNIFVLIFSFSICDKDKEMLELSP